MDVLAQFGPAGAIVAVVMLFLKYLSDATKQTNRINTEHHKTLRSLSKSIDKNTKVTEETHRFLKSLNGSLAKAVKDHL